jgi:hypothetical protein
MTKREALRTARSKSRSKQVLHILQLAANYSSEDLIKMFDGPVARTYELLNKQYSRVTKSKKIGLKVSISLQPPPCESLTYTTSTCFSSEDSRRAHT